MPRAGLSSSGAGIHAQADPATWYTRPGPDPMGQFHGSALTSSTGIPVIVAP
jgi:hypothetical protein